MHPFSIRVKIINFGRSPQDITPIRVTDHYEGGNLNPAPPPTRQPSTPLLAIVTFIGAWNNFFWPFIIITTNDMMTIPVGITQVKEMYGIAYARTMAVAVLAGLPVAVGYLTFQRKVTEGIMATAGLKG